MPRLSGAFSAVTMSSRLDGSPPMRPGALFVAVASGRRDGHDYVGDAFRHGARAALVAHLPGSLASGAGGPVEVMDYRSGAANPPDLRRIVTGRRLLFLVDDPVAALQRAATWWRRRFPVRAVGITGSVGKTTTKELVAAALGARYRVLRNPGNFNNELGLPITLLSLTEEHERVVLEIGISARGEMALFASLAGPDVAVVTVVAPAHLEAFGDLETVAREKGDLVAALPPDGLAVLNGDDGRVARMAERTRARVLLYGRGADCAVRAECVEGRGLDGIAFVAHARGQTRQVALPLAGTHFVYAALAALAVALEEGVPFDDAVAALAQPPQTQRLQPLLLPSGATLLDDTYNASPVAVMAALDVLAGLPGRRIAVLGDMYELGTHAERGHRDVGRHAARLGISALVAVGALGRHIGEEAQEAGLGAGRVRLVADNAAAVEALRALNLGTGDYVLIKGSHGLHMEEIVNALAH